MKNNISDNDPLKDAEDVAKFIDKTVQKKAKLVHRRYPLTLTLISLFGFSAVLSGFDSLISKNNFLADHPGLVLVSGLAVLLITGTLYKRLYNKEIRM